MTTEPALFPASDEVGHTVGEHALWQESVFFTWADLQSGVYGFHRIGQEVNAGLVTAWNGIATADGARYRRYHLGDIASNDRPVDGFSAGPNFTFTHDGYAARWRIQDEDCGLDLTTTDFTPRFDLFRAGGSVVENFAAGHLEVGATVTGSVDLGGDHIKVNGLAYRDHSWGKRDRSTMLSHRWIAGTFGPELTFNATSWHASDGSMASYGIVCRGGEITYATDVDIVVFMEIDALTHRGGVLRMTLEDGDHIELAASPVDEFLTHHHNTVCIDALCDVKWQGKRGFCDFEVSTNPRGGTGPVAGVVRAAHQNGLSRRPYSLNERPVGFPIPHVRQTG